jgi:hypothetical protein
VIEKGKGNFSVRGVNHREIPKQHVDVELTVAMHKIVQKVPKDRASRICRKKTEAAIELPTLDEDTVTRMLECRRESREVGLAVNQKCRPICLLDAPTILSFHANGRGIHGRGLIGKPAWIPCREIH